MILANVLTIVAALTALIAVNIISLPLCILGLCLAGLSYGSCPTVTAAYTESFFGKKYYATNYSINNFSLIATAFIAMGSNSLLSATGSYTSTFIMLLSLSAVALIANISLKPDKN